MKTQLLRVAPPLKIGFLFKKTHSQYFHKRLPQAIEIWNLNQSLFKSRVSHVSRSVLSDSLWPHGVWLGRLPCPSTTPRACSNSCPLSQWCHPTISSSVIPFSSCLQSLPASGSFLISQLFASGGQSSGASSVLPVNIQDWFSLGLTGLISLQAKGPSRVFSNTTVQKHQFFSTQFYLWFKSHIIHAVAAKSFQ